MGYYLSTVLNLERQKGNLSIKTLSNIVFSTVPLLFGCKTVGIIWIDLVLLSIRSPTCPVLAQFARKPLKKNWISGWSWCGSWYLVLTNPVTSDTPKRQVQV